jgi:tetratricopeptide (TPR) repeat protein
MNNKVQLAAAALVAVAGVVLLTILVAGRRAPQADPGIESELKQTIVRLERQVRAAESQREAAHEQVKELERELSRLAEARDEDRHVIKDLWAMVQAKAAEKKTPHGAEVEADQTADAAEPEAAPAEEGRQTTYDYDAVKKMIDASGGDLEAVLRAIVTPEGVDKLLEKYGDRPGHWAAAASLTPDREAALAYLEEAARLYPDSPAVLSALVGARIAAGRIDESTLAYAAQLQEVDPTNALGDCYEAYCQFEEGNIVAALDSLSQAGAKGRFADDRIGMLMARYDCLLGEGATDAVALGLSAFTLPLEHLGMLADGRLDEALKIAQDVASVGKTVSSSGRFLIHDRVGIAMQQAGLVEQQRIYEALGDVARMQEVGTQLQAIQERSATIDTMIQGFGDVLAGMAAEDLAGYVDSTILNGEFATLQNIPEIAGALNQPQSTQEAASEEPARP